MRRWTAIALALGILGVACEEMDEGTADAPAAQEETGAMEADETAAPGGAADEQPASGAQAALMTDSVAEMGPYLTDGNRIALYILEEDPQGESICYDECAREWPPFLASQGAPGAGSDEIRSDLIGTIQRDDGGTQVTYDGQPLYYYHDDEQPGDTHGHHVTDDWGEWYLVRPDGEHVEH